VVAKSWKNYGLQAIQNFTDNGLEHIFEGIKYPNISVGWHRFPSKTVTETYIVGGTKFSVDQYGLYTANVVINGVVKKGAGMSTFFPDNWSKQQVVDAINQAFKVKTRPKINNPDYWEGILPSGMKIGGYTKNEKIITSFPVKQ